MNYYIQANYRNSIINSVEFKIFLENQNIIVEEISQHRVKIMNFIKNDQKQKLMEFCDKNNLTIYSGIPKKNFSNAILQFL